MSIYAETLAKFEAILKQQAERVERLKNEGDFVDYTKLDKIVIGVVGGDGIGPMITGQAQRVLEVLLEDDIKAGKIEIRTIEGLTIENRVAKNKPIPDDVLAELKKCDVILKGPTTTPQKGDPWPNIESANVAMRKELDLFANVRPVKIPEQGIDWTFFRENTEGEYALGSQGVNVTEDMAFDFKVITSQGAERIARAARSAQLHTFPRRLFQHRRHYRHQRSRPAHTGGHLHHRLRRHSPGAHAQSPAHHLPPGHRCSGQNGGGKAGGID